MQECGLKEEWWLDTLGYNMFHSHVPLNSDTDVSMNFLF